MANIKFERYRLVLHHDFVDGETVNEIEKPIVIQFCYDRRYGGGAIVINEMIERLRDSLLSAIEAEEEDPEIEHVGYDDEQCARNK